jgi:hypothetical protein
MAASVRTRVYGEGVGRTGRVGDLNESSMQGRQNGVLGTDPLGIGLVEDMLKFEREGRELPGA